MINPAKRALLLQNRSMVICSRVDSEPGFRDFRYIAQEVATNLGIISYKNPETPGMNQEYFENKIITSDICLVLVGDELSPCTRREFKLAIENDVTVIVFIKTKDGSISKHIKNDINSLSKNIYQYNCHVFKGVEDLKIGLTMALLNYWEYKSIGAQFSLMSRGKIYKIVSDMLVGPIFRIILAQVTPVIVLGPRKYSHAEHIFYNRLMYAFHHKPREARFTNIYSEKLTLGDLNNPDYDIDLAQKNLFSAIKTDQDFARNTFICDNDLLKGFLIVNDKALFLHDVGHDTYGIQLNDIKNADVEEIIGSYSHCDRIAASNLANIYGAVV